MEVADAADTATGGSGNLKAEDHSTRQKQQG